VANQIDLICALQLMSADNSSTAPNGGCVRHVRDLPDHEA